MNGNISYNNREVVVSGNATGVINLAEGSLDAIVISKDQDTSNVAKSVTITCEMADGLTIAFGPLVIGNGANVYHPRKQALAADLSTVIAGVYERYYLTGKATVVVSAGDIGDVTRVKLVLVP